MIYKSIASILFIAGWVTSTLFSQTQLPIEELQKAIIEFKEDVRGPYKDIKWFCADGTFSEAKVPCNQEGSYQRARYKDKVLDFAKKHHVFIGQILAATDKGDFWDESNYYDRFKQYQVEQYLKLIDDGWVNRKSQFYRGSIQIEDEMKWGKEFLTQILSNDKLVAEQYFLVRQAAKTIPHGEDDQVKQKVRAISKNISDEESRFMKLRIKIHSNPTQSDIAETEKFLEGNDVKKEVKKQVDELLSEMQKMYAPIDYDAKLKSIGKLSTPSIKALLTESYRRVSQEITNFNDLIFIMDALREMRYQIINLKGNGDKRLRAVDYSIELESLLQKKLSSIEITELGDLNLEMCYLSGVMFGSGFIEKWEWEHLEPKLSVAQADTIQLVEMSELHSAARSGVEWASNMVRSHYNPTINKVGSFEPLAYGFIDDLIRSSILLEVGQSVARIGDWVSDELNIKNSIMGKDANQYRGLNPGYAKGKLEIVSGNIEDLAIDKDKIYVFDQPPSDLKPVAGIATVSEGNPVSHIQLLARNLGIPNSVLSLNDFSTLKKYNGDEVFYAVSPKGTVHIKLAKDMTKVESALFETKARKDERITVPIEKLKIEEDNILNLREIDKSFSGIYTGPKAANLGELKKLFPDNVVEGIVVPFGIFKKHMDMKMPNSEQSYWMFLNTIFEEANKKQEQGLSEEVIENYKITQLGILQDEIKRMQFLPEFELELTSKFEEILGAKMGSLAVFLRSDTNMEDLADFTGAGLNLTLFNVKDKDKILQGIKDVWASPYSERSYKWRQKYLLNPENVYPSILIIPSVNVDHSGVVITKGIKTDSPVDLTIAFSKGVGGAVDGQAAETYTIVYQGQDILDAPARESKYKYLPSDGGLGSGYTDFSKTLLSDADLLKIKWFIAEARQKIKLNNSEGDNQSLDIELGFLDKHLWLFQVRPFVENKNALGSEYLSSISPKGIVNKAYSYHTSIKAHE